LSIALAENAPTFLLLALPAALVCNGCIGMFISRSRD
jgi:hypothetical protein